MAEPRKPRPTVVTLCGSVRFFKQFQKSSLEETLAGKMVYSIGSASGTDEDHFGHLPEEERAAIIDRLNELHLRKIDDSDEILVLNCGGYVGIHTQREIDYAKQQGKKIRYLEPIGEQDES